MSYFHSRYPHSLCQRIRISVLKIAEKGVLDDKIRMSSIFRKRGSFLTKYSRKFEKGVILGVLRNEASGSWDEWAP